MSAVQWNAGTACVGYKNGVFAAADHQPEHARLFHAVFEFRFVVFVNK